MKFEQKMSKVENLNENLDENIEYNSADQNEGLL
jgi:hypothetical protein